MKQLPWFESLDVVISQWKKQFEGAFFDELDAATEEQERLVRYWARRDANMVKARRVLVRLRRVESIDLYAMTSHIPPDFFGERHLQFAEIKALYRRKAKIAWFLTGLYHYLAFDREYHGWRLRDGRHYSRHRKHYDKMLLTHEEKIKQKQWDKKCEQVRKARAKREANRLIKEQENYNLRRGLNNTARIK